MLQRADFRHKLKEQRCFYTWKLFSQAKANAQIIKENSEFIERLTYENFRLKSEPNHSYRDGYRDTNLYSSPNFKETKSLNTQRNRYQLRNASPYSVDKDFRFLNPEIEDAVISESPTPRKTASPTLMLRSKSTTPSNFYYDGYDRLRNKQWIDNLYENGKQKLMSRSRSVYMSLKEAEELKECTFHPRIKHNQLVKKNYHNSVKSLIWELTKQPTKDKARELKRIKEEEERRKWTFTPKLSTDNTRQCRSRSVFEELYGEKKRREISRHK